MATISKRPASASFALQRELVELVRRMDLNAIVKKTGRKPKAILISARRLGIKIKERK